jgi:hypothetical protein
MQVIGPPALQVFLRKKSGFKEQVFQGTEKLSVKMKEIKNKMGEHVPESFPGLNIFLPANMAISAMQGGITV